MRGPQAFRLALAPMTNDFVALLKDSSLVSVITVVELTKQTRSSPRTSAAGSFPASLCAALYLVLSLPLSRLARRLETRWRAADGMSALLAIDDLRLRRGAREILRGVNARTSSAASWWR